MKNCQCTGAYGSIRGLLGLLWCYRWAWLSLWVPELLSVRYRFWLCYMYLCVPSGALAWAQLPFWLQQQPPLATLVSTCPTLLWHPRLDWMSMDSTTIYGIPAWFPSLHYISPCLFWPACAHCSSKVVRNRSLFSFKICVYYACNDTRRKRGLTYA